MRTASRWWRAWDGATWRHAAMVALALAAFVVSVSAAPEQAAATAADSSALIAQWLSPYTILSAALVLLYVGELRGDLKRVKERLETVERTLKEEYMPRLELNAELKAIEARHQLRHRERE